MTTMTNNNIYVPKEVLFNVFSCLSTSDLMSCSRVNQAFRQIALNKMLLESRFPSIALPEGVTIQQWFLQSIHSQDDLMKCIEHYFSRIPNRQVIALRFSSPLGTSLEVFLGYGVEVFSAIPAVKVNIQVDADILPKDSMIHSNTTFSTLSRGLLRSDAKYSIKLDNVFETHEGHLIEKVTTTIEKVVANTTELRVVLGKAVARAVRVFKRK
ncbi:MAG: F-box protein [Rhabdochlamydiaceae bacterium]|jgi:hypothetical protein